VSVSRVLRVAVWAALALLLGFALYESLGRQAAAVDKAQAAAQARAEDYANTVLYRALAPGTLDEPIESREYGELLVDVQAGILSDDDVVRVRVWNDAGELAFSSDQRDRLGQEIDREDVLRTVLQGSAVSEKTGARVPQLPGLAGANEPLLETYAPLRLGEQTSPSGVAEIQQRYSAIQAVADKVWRPIQAGLGVALLGALVMLVVSIRRGDGRSTAMGDPRAAERVRSLERRLRDAEKRAREAAERVDAMTAAKVALEEQLSTSERNLRDTLTARRANEEEAASIIERVPQLERQLAEARARALAAEAAASGVSPEDLAAAQARATEASAERDRLAAEVERLNSVATEITAARQRALDLETRLAELEAAGSSSDARLAEAETRAAAAEQRVREADRRTAEVEERLTEADRRAANVEDRLSQSLEQAQSDLDRTSLGLSETQAALAESSDKLNTLQAELEAAQREKAEAVSALENIGEATGDRDREVEQLRTSVVARDAELEQLRTSVVAKNAELEQLRAEAVAKNEELERMRGEVQEAHEQLATAQLEMTQARSRIEDLMGIAIGTRGPASPPASAPTRSAGAETTADGARSSDGTEELSIRERLLRAAASRERASAPPDAGQR
jgi:hypothetical protein